MVTFARGEVNIMLFVCSNVIVQPGFLAHKTPLLCPDPHPRVVQIGAKYCPASLSFYGTLFYLPQYPIRNSIGQLDKNFK